jgi:3',5'-cyclic AMP phosphodiesterase CpdA
MTLVQLSDPHLRVGARDRESAEALEVAVRSILALDPVPEAVLVTGDIADTGAAGEYERARTLLGALHMPVYVLPGNHDDRDGLRAHFEVPGDGAFIQYAFRCAGVRVVACDSTVPGQDGASLDGGRLDWLAAELAADTETPTVVAMHHPPLTIGLPVLDAIAVNGSDRTGLAKVLAGAPQVRRLVTGHVHRTAVGVLGGCGVLACTSSYEQAKLELGASELTFVNEPPAFAVHVLLDGQLISHIQPIRRTTSDR